MHPNLRAIVWFSEISKEDIPLVGGKGANLGEMTGAKIPVPPGFIVTVDAYHDFLRQAGISHNIQELLKTMDIQDSKQLQRIAGEVKQLITNATMPPETVKAIKKAYTEMGEGLVAVRSSATAEDLPDASFAGQQDTYLNIQGGESVVDAVQRCWASLFEARAIFYRQEQGFDHFKVGIAVPVQRMVQSQASGIMFTLEPMTSDTSKITIEAGYGLGEALVSGSVTPDLYIVDKKDLKILSRTIGKQDWKLVKDNTSGQENTNIKVPLTPDEQAEQKITDDEIILLSRIAKRIEDWYKFPQDIEWAKDDGEFYIVQTRPVTTIKTKGDAGDLLEIGTPVLLSGTPASPGIASGAVKIVSDASQIDKVKSGEILVAKTTTPDFVPAMKRAAAIVTDHGGRTAHAAIISRELGIPCIVGTEHATATLKDKQVITVDGSRGTVYDGKISMKKAAASAATPKKKIKTRTRVYVNLAQPDLADQVAKRDVDGVGLLRAEFIIAGIGEHPNYMLSQNRGQEFVDKLARGITKFAKAFSPRPVVYRTNDLKTNEYRALKGGGEYESVEENPMLGYRGVSRYTTDIDVFNLELEAIKQVRRDYPNLWVMIPFVRTVDGLAGTIKIMESAGLKRSKDFKIWMMAELPSNLILLEKFIDVGIDGISIGSNDLTQLILGVDRDSEKLSHVFDERNEAVLVALERLVTVSKNMGITCSICGQAPSVYPELTEKLVEWGITSVSVSPDMIDKTREIVAGVEKKLKIS